MEVRTKFLIISDSHAMDFRIPNVPVDAVIHCGDLTEESKLEEFRKSIDQLERIQAPLKLLMKKEYGDVGEACQLFSASNDIIFLDEGIHHFNLPNGAKLTFLRGKHHDYTIGKEVDVVITHGPPKGIGYLDRTVSQQRAGCDHLFSAIAKARPRLHCFGHIHEGWGAMLVAWKGEGRHAATAWEKEKRYQWLVKEGFRGTSHCSGDEHPLIAGRHTLFVNAAIESLEEEEAQLPWIVEIELPRSTSPNELTSA
ncbi:Metallo-dependent phosphatase-like protein [Coniochaeta sp. 2T2.1]|nr:Metallo-dependent phosphatase-like protein [Coniochaeta sp. 2T2.1]